MFISINNQISHFLKSLNKMENQFLDQDNHDVVIGSGLSSEDKNYLHSAARWARFLGIVGFVGTAFMLIATLLIMVLGLGSVFSALTADSPYGGIAKGMASFMTIFLLGIVVLYFFMSLYMYNFGTKTKLAVEQDDSTTMTEGLKNLKSLFKLWGIVAAVFIGLYALQIVVAIGMAMFMR